jgi:hypothetical protein
MPRRWSLPLVILNRRFAHRVHYKDLNGLLPRFQPESEVGIWRLAEAREGSRRKNCASENQELGV